MAAKDPKVKRSSLIYVGSGSVYDFEDPDRGHHGQQKCPDTGQYYSNVHCGGCGFIQASFLRSSIKRFDPCDPEAFIREVLDNSTIKMLAIAILKAIKRAVEQAVAQVQRRGSSSVHIEARCDKGHRRSELVAEIGAYYCELLDLSTGIRRHHLRVIPGIRDKQDCECWTGRCRFPPGHSWTHAAWHDANQGMREKIRLCMLCFWRVCGLSIYLSSYLGRASRNP